jgi:hypothetical protein
MMSTENSGIDMYSLMRRLTDAEIPGHCAAFTDAEAAFLGAFDEDAVTPESAMAGSYHNPELVEEARRELLNG